MMSDESQPKPGARALTATPLPESPQAKQDVVFVHSEAEDGQGYNVLRKRDDTLEVGQIRALKEGEPIHGDIVRLSPREDSPRLFNVDVLVRHERGTPKPARSGPAQVANDAYRANWEHIFGSDPRTLN